ncbi:replication/maintenance protein RepL (plasmid) [Tenacibaculum finnmarkense]|nr:replication/maintenance protein RepL [Tenacibaculum finnmarkense]
MYLSSEKTVLDIVSSGLLGKNEYRILLYLMAKTEFEKEINITQYRIAKELGMQENAVGLVLRKLDSFNILIRDNKLKRLRLNYEIGYKGSPKNYKKIQYNDNPST